MSSAVAVSGTVQAFTPLAMAPKQRLKLRPAMRVIWNLIIVLRRFWRLLPLRRHEKAPMDTSEEYFNRVFSLTDELLDIERRLLDGFSELSFLFLSEDVLGWLRRNHSLTLETLRIDIGSQPRQDLKARRADVIFHFGNYLASAQAAIDFLYNYGKNGHFTEGLLAQVHGTTDRLKKCPPQRLLTALRNRMVHAPPLLDKVSVEVRTQHHAAGAGAHLCAVLTERATLSIETDLPADPSVRNLWEEVRRQHNDGKDWLTPLLDAHSREFEEAFAAAKALALNEYREAFDAYNSLKARLDEIEAELAGV